MAGGPLPRAWPGGLRLLKVPGQRFPVLSPAARRHTR